MAVEALKLDNVKKNFAGTEIIRGLNLSVAQDERHAVIGPNGAGKTTLFNVIAGLYKPDSGHVLLDGEDITGLPPHQLFHKGLLRTFQIAHEFSTLTVRDNLKMVPSGQSGERLLDAWFRPSVVREEEQKLAEKAEEVIQFLQLELVRCEKF